MLEKKAREESGGDERGKEEREGAKEKVTLTKS